VFFLVMLAGYQAAVTVVPTFAATLPDLGELAAGAVDVVADARFWLAIVHTIVATLLGLSISLALGTVIGLVLSLHRNAWASSRFVVDFMRTIPPIALVPIALLVLGVSMGMEVTLIVIAAVWPVILQVYYGISTVEPELLETARIYRLTVWQRLALVTTPAMLPPFATAVRISATLSLLLAVGTEVITSSGGLGALISRLQQVSNTTESLIVIIATGLVGLGLNALLQWAQHTTLHWHYRTTKGDS
jgi:ABC-type nitrate/sulfonate/bicarbonate transport system permease component